MVRLPLTNTSADDAMTYNRFVAVYAALLALRLALALLGLSAPGAAAAAPTAGACHLEYQGIRVDNEFFLL